MWLGAFRLIVGGVVLKPARRLGGFGTSIFTEMTRLAVQHRAINLGQGFPDFPAPDFIKEAAARAIAADHNQYAPAPGVLRLRRAIAARFELRQGRAVDPDGEVTVAAGATEILFDAILALLDPGDEAIVFEPFYDAYLPDIQMAGGTPRVVTLRPPHWRFDPDELRAAFSPRTRLIVLNTPHNPTGKVFSPEELDFIAGLCREHDVIAISDEVYSELVYPGARHVPIATRPGMWERTVTVDSIGKTFSVTGWKIGWAIAAPALTAAIRGVHQFVTFANATPFQEAAADALAEAEVSGYYDRLRADYRARRELLTDILHAAGLQTLPVEGAYFLLADIAALPFPDDTAFCRHLISEVGVAAIPPSAFYADPRTAPRLARFCFAKRDETMRAAAERLAAMKRL
jgi:aspartate/methionine/tyrosine aminotransferase